MRLYFLYQYRPALLGFPDSVVYVIDAHQGLFADPLRVSGYALFLRLLHGISDHLVLVPIVQHGLGLLAGLLLFDAMRRTGARIGLGLVPAAVVMLGGAELMLEHALLSDSLFVFLVIASLWLLVRAWYGSAWWGLGVGLSIGCATIDRTVGLELLPFMLICLLIGPRRNSAPSPQKRWPSIAGNFRARHRTASHRVVALLLTALGAFAVVFPFISAHQQQTGSYGFASASYFDFYGRVAPWAECSKFTPPPGTRKLCVDTPKSQRLGTEAWEFLGTSPAVQAYGIPEWFGPAPQKNENSQLRAFALAAIEAEPLEYLHYVSRDLVRVIDPTFPTSPYKKIGDGDYGDTPEELLTNYFDTSNFGNIDAVITSYYASPGLRAGNVSILESWERDTRLEGPLMVVILILALLAPVLASGGPRRFAILCDIVSLVLIVAPILVIDYDWRFMIPAFGPLTASAAIGGYEIFRRGRTIYGRLRKGSDATDQPRQPLVTAPDTTSH
jgi:hypothetical protein